jgi:hypothetical protein
MMLQSLTTFEAVKIRLYWKTIEILVKTKTRLSVVIGNLRRMSPENRLQSESSYRCTCQLDFGPRNYTAKTAQTRRKDDP